MKKSIAVLMVSILLILSFSSAFSAFAEAPEFPTVIVAGYSATNLYLDKEDGTTQRVWGVNVDDILSLVLHRIAQIGMGLGAMAFGNTKLLADTVGQGFVDLYGVLACNPDGTSIYPLHPYSQKAEDLTFSQIYAAGNDILAHEPEIMATVAELYGENGYDNIFSFQTDFRMNVVQAAADLDVFIEDILSYTGADKVNIYAVSHGGEVSAVYFSEYGYKGHVNNAVLTIPAIGGAALAYDVMSENIRLDEETLLRFIENGMMWEEDYEWLVKAQQLGILDPLCNRLMADYVKQILGNWGSIWDFIPCEFYEELKTKYLDPVENAAIIEKSDYYHYTLMPSMSENLSKCREYGTNVYIVAGADNPSVTGLQMNSDGIITVNSSTGASCAPIGMRFSDGYETIGSVCSDAEHDHLAPAMNIDASTCYLPDQTWFISGLFHGMTWKDPYAIDLCCMLLTSREKVTVYSYEEYPQFRYSFNPCYTVYAEFDHSVPGFVNEEDTSLNLTNLSAKNVLQIKSVNCYGTDLQFDVKPFTFLKPGETVCIKVKGDLPKISGTTADITVNYVLLGNITPYGSRTMTFTISNGKNVEKGEGYTSLHSGTPFDNSLSENGIVFLKKSGLFDLLKMIYNYFAGLFKIFG